ncbi:MAG TPA: tRNA 2-selenouridine(34) synthase MnmH [Burkholderiales bacterium]|nr:tRNA 2-selenouridine(34) synthase MnmH [Burkholderiales bacterium]
MASDLLASFDAILDARSPAEFAQDHLPGARSLPVLGNTERAYIGTVYKQQSPFEAKRQGAALVSRNIARHLETALAGMPRSWRPLVYCWRGGKRSGAFAHVLREVGWDAHTLEGGYQAYRRWIIEQLARLPGSLRLRVVHGATGSGKSRLLHALARSGAQVLDLEALAAHRGSVLGNLPGQPQPPQKLFESRLYAALAALSPARPVFVEGESRKIGQLQVPEALITAMRASECVLLEADPQTRVALLMDEYRHFFDDTASLGAQLDCLQPLHGRARIESWKALAAQGAFEALVARLLDEHYDPAYRRSAARNFARLAEAPVLRVASPGRESFAELARTLAA